LKEKKTYSNYIPKLAQKQAGNSYATFQCASQVF